MQDWLSSMTNRWFLAMGVIFILVVMYLEGGLVSLFPLGRQPDESTATEKG